MSNLAIKSFASGEIAPALYARTDIARYEIGLRTCRNMIVMRQGGATKRPGTEYVCEVKDSTTKVRLVPFAFNVSDTLVLEFGDQYLRFLQNGGVVVDPVDHTIPYEIATPFLVADLPGLQLVQSADVVTIVHPSYPPQELRRQSDTDWNINPIVFGATLPAPTISSVTLGDPATSRDTSYIITRVGTNGEESLGSAPVTNAHPPTATSPVFLEAVASGADTFNVYRQDGAHGLFGFIGAGIGDVIAFFDFGQLADNTLQPPVDQGLFQSPGDYPSVVAYYQQRLLFANSNNAPDTVWGSRTGYYHNFTKSAISQDDDAVTFRLVSDEVDAIRHILNLGRLVIETEGAEWLVEGDGNGVLTPAAVNARVGSYNGGSRIRPIKADNRLLFVQALGSSVREMQTNVQFGYYSLEGADVTIYSSHLVDGFAITDWAWQQIPPHVVWAVRSDGALLGLTYIPEQQVLAWHRHDTIGFVENVCVVAEGPAHWLYVVVRRLINGAYRRYIERMTTSDVLPVFTTPEGVAGSPGGVVTPPPPPPPPPPSKTPVPPPTNATTTDVSTTSATANWTIGLGTRTGDTQIAYRLQGGSDTSWVTQIIPGTSSSYVMGALLSGTAYEWRVAHVIGTVFSEYLGPSAATQFTTVAVVLQLPTPATAPVIDAEVHLTGLTTAHISWSFPATGVVSRLQIAGPTDLDPTDGEFSDIGVFVGAASLWVTTLGGTYWLRVRSEETGFTSSEWAGPSSWFLTVNS